MSTVAKQFSDFASKRDFRLGERPGWQRAGGGQGATKVYAKMREASYRANAPLIRNRRLAQSIGYDPNYALNVKLNREISDRHFMDAMTAHTTDATEKLRGLRSHIKPIFTNTHGALSSFQAPGLVGSLQKGDGWGGGMKSVANNAASTIQGAFRWKQGYTPSPTPKPASAPAPQQSTSGSSSYDSRYTKYQQAKAAVVRKSRQRALGLRLSALNKKFDEVISGETSEAGKHHLAPIAEELSLSFQSPAAKATSKRPHMTPAKAAAAKKRTLRLLGSGGKE